MHENSPDPSTAGDAVRAALFAAARQRRVREVSAVVWRVAPVIAAVRDGAGHRPQVDAVESVAAGDGARAGRGGSFGIRPCRREASCDFRRRGRRRGRGRRPPRGAAQRQLVCRPRAARQLGRSPSATRCRPPRDPEMDALYPSVRAPRARAATAVFAIAALALTVVLPERVSVPRTASASSPSSPAPPPRTTGR